MIVQIVRASIKPEARDRWLEMIRWNAPETRAEDGCVSYQVAEDLESPNTFVLVELWTDMDAVYSHFRQQFERVMASLGDAFAAPPEASMYEIAKTTTLDEVLDAVGIAVPG
jgi:quinol monooxygenase YgiN